MSADRDFPSTLGKIAAQMAEANRQRFAVTAGLDLRKFAALVAEMNRQRLATTAGPDLSKLAWQSAGSSMSKFAALAAEMNRQRLATTAGPDLRKIGSRITHPAFDKVAVAGATRTVAGLTDQMLRDLVDATDPVRTARIVPARDLEQVVEDARQIAPGSVEVDRTIDLAARRSVLLDPPPPVTAC